MNREQLLHLLRTGYIEKDPEGKLVAHRIEDMPEDELRQAVIEFVYSRI